MDRRSPTAWATEGKLRPGPTAARVARAGAVSDHPGTRTERRGQSPAEDSRGSEHQARLGGFGSPGSLRSADARRTDRRLNRRGVHGGVGEGEDASEARVVGAGPGRTPGTSPAVSPDRA